MPSPRRNPRRRSRERRSGRRKSGALRKGPSRQAESGRGKREEEEEFYETGKNWTPHIIGGSVAGVILLIFLLVWIASPPPGNGIDPGENGTVKSEVDIERRAKELTIEAERRINIYFSHRTAANRQRAVEAIHRAIETWNILLDIYPDSTGLQHEISMLSEALSDIHKMPPLE